MTKSIKSTYGEVLIGSFEEVLYIPGCFLNDHCLILKDDQWHLFSIVYRGDSKNVTSFVHATSTVLRDWKLHPDVMEISGVWPEIKMVIAPNVIEHDGLFYMLYGALDDLGTQRICLAISKDLYEWERYKGNPVIVPSVFWSKWPGFGLDAPDGQTSFGGCRDPHIIRLDDGRFVAYWVSRLQEKFGEDMTCVAASISNDLIHWQEVGPVFQLKAWHVPLTMEVESPCVVFKDVRYWLFFKHGWWTHFVTGKTPFDFYGNQSIRLGYSHASEIFCWENQWWITHCKTDPDDFMCKSRPGKRGFFISKLDWQDGEYPKLV